MLAAAAFVAVALSLSGSGSALEPGERRSGFADMSRETQAMQTDDAANPGMLAVLEGETLWQTNSGESGLACSDCHGDARDSMRGVAARYPTFDAKHGQTVTLAGRVVQCRTERQRAAAPKAESPELLALTAFVSKQSRGMAIDPPRDPRLQATRDLGKALFDQRQGQLNLSCSTCHNANGGKRLAGALIPQGHPNGYPLYRLEWQAMGSLARRLRNCMVGMRAESYAADSPEFVALEAYLMERAAGLPMESPAVRP